MARVGGEIAPRHHLRTTLITLRSSPQGNSPSVVQESQKSIVVQLTSFSLYFLLCGLVTVEVVKPSFSTPESG